MPDALALPFRKMHGLGNDFVILDRRGAPLAGAALPALARAMADRRRGVGFDQMVVIGDDAQAEAALAFLNADGSEAGACGNGTRCVARLLMDEAGVSRVRLRTARGLLECRDAGGDVGGHAGGHAGADVSVNMGAPRTGWRDVPLAEPCDTLRLPLPGEPVACSMGNPHCSVIVPDAEAADLDALGRLERHPLFPERTNVQAVSVEAPGVLRVRVWERGVGVTPASGSSACAAAVACARRGLSGRRVSVRLDGGALAIDWREDGVWMTGPTAHAFDGVWSLA